jgi:flagellar biosynthesis protein FliP
MTATAVQTRSAAARSRAGRRLAVLLLLALLAALALVLSAGPASAAPGDPVTPTVPATGPVAPVSPVAPTNPAAPAAGNGVNISVGNGTPSSSITLILAITVLSIAPSVLLLATSFTKIIVVLGLTRNALGLQQGPPNQVLTGIALFLTLFVMGPVFSDINDVAVQPYMDGKVTVSQAYDAGVVPLREFLLDNTRSDELKLMVGLSGEQKPADPSKVSMTTLIPAFVLSELKSAFIIGLVVFIPFLVLDMLVSAALMAMGMMMVPPTVVSLPFKLLLFVVVDGWSLITTALVGSYGGG